MLQSLDRGHMIPTEGCGASQAAATDEPASDGGFKDRNKRTKLFKHPCDAEFMRAAPGPMRWSWSTIEDLLLFFKITSNQI